MELYLYNEVYAFQFCNVQIQDSIHFIVTALSNVTFTFKYISICMYAVGLTVQSQDELTTILQEVQIVMCLT